jgi:hypothetical protein
MKVTFALLGVVAIVVFGLFALGVTCSGGGGCSDQERDAWRTRMLGASAVAPGQISGCTTALAPFTFSGGCALVVAAADARSRQLTITAVDAVTISFDTDADGRTISSHDDLSPGKQRRTFIGEAGQIIRLFCPGSSCRARLSKD